MRTWLRYAILLILVIGFAILLQTPLLAQTSNGAIVGNVTDRTGAGIANATITVTSSDRGDVHMVECDAAGTFRVESLLPGKYVVEVSKGGFSTLKFNNIDVRGSLDSTADAVLEISAQTTTVLVEGNTGVQLDTQSAEISGNFSTKEIQNLPIGTLNPIELVFTEPGVATPTVGGFSNGINFSVNGERPRANNFLIDGQDNNDNSIAGQAFQPTNLEAIGGVSILENSYSAEFGRGGGSVTNVLTKSGTNNWHGAAFELANNSALDTLDAASKLAGVTKIPVNVENTFGFSIGGPIVKNKLFFFASPQWDRDRSTANGSTLTLPTANGVATLKSLLPNPNVQFLLDSLAGLVGSSMFADGTFHTLALGGGRPGVETGQTQRGGVSEVSNDRQVYARVDLNLTSRDIFSFHYIRDDNALTPDFFNFSGSLLPYDSLQGGNANIAGLTYTRTFSSKLVNEFRVSYTGIDFAFAPTGATAANPLSSKPSVSIAGTGFPTFGFPTGLPQGRAHKNYQFQELLSYSVGQHTLRGGIDAALLHVQDLIPINSRGTLTYNAGGGFRGLGNFVDDFSGISGGAAISFGAPLLKPQVVSYAPYFEDTWRIRNNFTGIFGLRYEYYRSPENVLPFPALDGSLGIGVPGATFPGSFAFKNKEDKNNWAPRLGFAYTPHMLHWLTGGDKTVIRAGAGMFYDVLFTNILDNTGAAQPNAPGGLINGAASQNAGRGIAALSTQFPTLTPILNPLGGITTINSNLVNPQSYQWNLNIERQLPGGFLFSAAYVGTRGIRLYMNQELNPRVDFGARINPNFGPITDRTNGASSIYHSGQFKLERSFARGFFLRTAYTYSKLISTADEVFTVTGASSTSFTQDPFNVATDRGRSDYDHTHVFSTAVVYSLPYVHRTEGGMRVLNLLTRDWQTSAILLFETGSPGNVTSGVDTNGDGRGTNDRPNLGSLSAPLKSAAVDGANPNFGITPTPGTYFEIQNAINCNALNDPVNPCIPVNPSSFHWLIPASGLGNAGRNSIGTPGFQTWNLSVERKIRITERQGLQIRGDFFNAFNHPNLSQPSLTLTSPDFADTANTRNGARLIKIFLRYSF